MEEETRAVQLAQDAQQLADSGSIEEASRKVREAISLAAENSEVKAAFVKIYQNEETHLLLNIVRRFTLDKDVNATAGQEAVRLLKSSTEPVPNHVAVEAIKLVLDQKPSTLSNCQDEIIVELVRRSSEVRNYLAQRMTTTVTELFDDLYERGDGATNCMDTIALDVSAWPSEQLRSKAEEDLLLLFIARLMESGHDHDGRAMKGITRLLVTDAEKLKGLIDADSFDSILSALDIRESAEVRSQATLATAKYLEVAKETGERMLQDFIVSKVSVQRNDDLIVAVSAAAAIFPIIPPVMASLFLTEGFLPSLMPLLDRKGKSTNVEQAVLELFNAACVDQACREAISKYCVEWLTHMVSNGEKNRATNAAVILAKVRASGSVTPPEARPKIKEGKSVNDLVDMFKIMISKTSENNKQSPIEGLAFATIRPSVKEKLARDPNFIANFFTVLKTNRSKPAIVFGGLTILANLSNYLPNLSEEQKKMSQLKAYANSSEAPAPDPQDDDEHVAHRCNILVKAGVISTLIEVCRDATPGSWNLICTIIRSLAQKPKNRGLLVQQGAVKLLLSESLQKLGSTPSGATTYRIASHALARILISVNPSLAFPASGIPQLTSAVRPLISLLVESDPSSDGPRDLLPTFEALLALTNLASPSNKAGAEAIIRLAWAAIEDLLLSNNTLVQRAATELVCNLVTCPSGMAKFTDGSARAGQRLHILVALADAEDPATRSAAGGALAQLTQEEDVVSGVLGLRRGIEIVLDLVSDEKEELMHRGIVCVGNMIFATGETGQKAKTTLKEKGAVDVLKRALQKTKNMDIIAAGVEALKPLVE